MTDLPPDQLDGIPPELHSSITAWQAARAEADRRGIEPSFAPILLADHRYAVLLDYVAALVVHTLPGTPPGPAEQERERDAVKIPIEVAAVEKATAVLRGYLDANPEGEPT